MTLLRIAHWLLPWAAVLVVSTAIACAASDALAHNAHQSSALVALDRPEPRAQAPDARSVCTETCRHWVSISSRNQQGQLIVLTCLVDDGNISADGLEVPSVELGSVVVRLCRQLWQASTD